MALSNLEVIGIMGRCDFHAAGSEFLVHIGVCNHRDFTVRKRELQHLAHDILIALILRVHGYRGIAQHGFRPGCGNLHKPSRLAHHRIINMPEKSVLFHMFDFRV